MKKIVKISMLALLGLGLAGCTSSDYDNSNEIGKMNTYHKLLGVIDRGEYEIEFTYEEEAIDFIETLSSLKLDSIESIDYESRESINFVVVKFKPTSDNIDTSLPKSEDSSIQSGSSSSKIKEKIIEKDGKRYRVTVEEIVEDPAEEIAEQAVEETVKSGE